MNFDLYGIDVPFEKPPTPKPDSTEATSSSSATAALPASPSLNDEVTQAIGTLGSFWGSFRKQSQSAFALARKDLGQVAAQARSEFDKIANEVSAPTASTTGEPSATSTEDTSSPIDVKGKGKERAIDQEDIPSNESHPPSSPTSTFFSRLQAQLPPNLQPSAIATTLSNTTSNAPTSIAQLRSSLATNISRAQTNLNVAQAERLAEAYLHKSTDLFNQAGEFLKDAVKVLPPAGEAGDITDAALSGGDIWMFASPIGTAGWGGVDTNATSSSNSPAAETSTGKSTLANLNFTRAATRSEALLRRLMYDPDMLRLDPSKDDAVKADFEAFEGKRKEAGEEAFVQRIAEVLRPEKEDGELDADKKALIDTRDVLVPNEMTNDVFWSRYFFRIEQISREEDKRKALLADAVTGEEDFSWEDDEDEQTAPAKSAAAVPPAITTTTSATSTSAPPPKEELSSASTTLEPPSSSSNASLNPPPSTAQTSPRISEDGSFDLVEPGTGTVTPAKGTATSLTASAPTVPSVPEATNETNESIKAKEEVEEKKKKDQSDDDSDWE